MCSGNKWSLYCIFQNCSNKVVLKIILLFCSNIDALRIRGELHRFSTRQNRLQWSAQDALGSGGWVKMLGKESLLTKLQGRLRTRLLALINLSPQESSAGLCCPHCWLLWDQLLCLVGLSLGSWQVLSVLHGPHLIRCDEPTSLRIQPFPGSSQGQRKSPRSREAIWMSYPLFLFSVVLIFHSAWQVCFESTTLRHIREPLIKIPLHCF